MEKIFRRILVAILGTQRYLSLISHVFLWLIIRGQLKNKYGEFHFIADLIKEGDHCIDIGANLGYYSVLMSRAAGKEGKVYAVEPVSSFQAVFNRNVASFAKGAVKLLPYALGKTEKNVQMGTPKVDGVFRHGLTSVLSAKKSDSRKIAKTYEVEMKVPDKLFAGLERLDYVKCDIEGYEMEVFPAFMETIKKHKPLIQIEINSAENRKAIYEILKPVGYAVNAHVAGRLTPLDKSDYLNYEGGDFYFKIINN